MSTVNTKRRKIVRMPVSLKIKTIDIGIASPKKPAINYTKPQSRLRKGLNDSGSKNLNHTESIIKRTENKIVSNFINSLFDEPNYMEENSPKKIPKSNYNIMENSPTKDKINNKNKKGILKNKTSRLNKTSDIQKNNDLGDFKISEDYKIKFEMNQIYTKKQLCEEELRKVNEQIELLKKKQNELNQELLSLQKKENELNDKYKKKSKKKEEEKNGKIIDSNKKKDESKEEKEKKEKKEEKEKKDKKDKKDKKEKKKKKKRYSTQAEEAAELIKFFNNNADKIDMIREALEKDLSDDSNFSAIMKTSTFNYKKI